MDGGTALGGTAGADVAPRLASVGGLVDAIAEANLRADIGFTSTGVDDVGHGWRDGNGADGRGGLPVEERSPGHAGVHGFPNATADRSEVERGGIAGDAGDGDSAAAAERADQAPLKVIK